MRWFIAAAIVWLAIAVAGFVYVPRVIGWSYAAAFMILGPRLVVLWCWPRLYSDMLTDGADAS